MSRLVGSAQATFAGEHAAEILFAARHTIETQRRGFVFLHWPDADAAGHEHGWMSAEYGRAARRLDAALGFLALLTDVEHDPRTLLIACADHGGGGVNPKHHDSAHPFDRTIPIVLAGGAVRPGRLRPDAHWLDIPATVAWALGVPAPTAWPGRPLHEAFAAATVAA